ncbi:ATP-binding cassette domain-containing protein [Clostridiaceae bacterium M8S5]|nr:ATP-binding cassette domain-containing protein [Clostridiaceae bacterium M8S5]
MASVIMDNIRKEYIVNSNKISVLNGISHVFEDETITVILGKSGCGKTTLLRLISGLEKQSSGSIDFRGSGSKVGIVFQENRLMPWLTVEDNIKFSLNKSDNATVESYLKIMGLLKFSSAYPNQISGGMAQRASIARTLAYNPDVILMDEPFAALDYFTRQNLQQKLLEIFEVYNKTIIFITHNVDEALLLGHTILVLDNGVIIKKYDLNKCNFPRDISSKYLLEIKKNIIDTISKNHKEVL